MNNAPTETSNIHPPTARSNLHRIDPLTYLRRPSDYYGGHPLQSAALMNRYPQEGEHHDESPIWNRRPGDQHAMIVHRGTVERQVMSEMLDMLGYRVTQAEDSGKALLYFGREPFEVVISDLYMPQFSGFQLAQCIRNHSPQTRVLLMTPCCQAEVADYMESRVVDGWLFKPFRMDVLKDMLVSVKAPERDVRLKDSGGCFDDLGLKQQSQQENDHGYQKTVP